MQCVAFLLLRIPVFRCSHVTVDLYVHALCIIIIQEPYMNQCALFLLCLCPLRIGYGQHHHQQHSRVGQRWRVRDCVLRVHDVYIVVYSTSCVDAQPTRFTIHRRPPHTDAPSFPTLTPSRNIQVVCVCVVCTTHFSHTPQVAHAQKYRELLLSYEWNNNVHI